MRKWELRAVKSLPKATQPVSSRLRNTCMQLNSSRCVFSLTSLISMSAVLEDPAVSCSWSSQHSSLNFVQLWSMSVLLCQCSVSCIVASGLCKCLGGGDSISLIAPSTGTFCYLHVINICGPKEQTLIRLEQEKC